MLLALAKTRNREIQLVLGESHWALMSHRQDWLSGVAQGWMDALARARAACEDLPVSQDRRSTLVVWLSGRLCPALTLHPPEGLRTDAEQRAWLRNAVAQQSPPGHDLKDAAITTHEQGAGKALLVAAWPKAVHAALFNDWPGRTEVRAVRPLWRAATELAAVQGASTRLLTVYDQDAATQFEVDETGKVLTASTRNALERAAALAWHRRRSATLDTQKGEYFARWQAPSTASPWDAAWATDGGVA